MSTDTNNEIVKNKYLASMKKYLNFKYLGVTFWGANLFALTNKNDPTSKVVYAFEMDNGYKVEIVNIYDGVVTRLTNYNKTSFNIATGNNYQKGIVLDLIFASFISSIKISDKTKGVVYTYYKDNIIQPQIDEASFKLGDFELYVHDDRVELFIPNFDKKITGDYKKLPMINSPEIQWRNCIDDTVPYFKNEGWFD